MLCLLTQTLFFQNLSSVNTVLIPVKHSSLSRKFFYLFLYCRLYKEHQYQKVFREIYGRNLLCDEFLDHNCIQNASFFGDVHRVLRVSQLQGEEN
jgi:hypothetical protein